MFIVLLFRSFAGHFDKQKANGFASIEMADGSSYRGSLMSGRRHGGGCLMDSKGNVVVDSEVWQLTLSRHIERRFRIICRCVSVYLSKCTYLCVCISYKSVIRNR